MRQFEVDVTADDEGFASVVFYLNGRYFSLFVEGDKYQCSKVPTDNHPPKVLPLDSIEQIQEGLEWLKNAPPVVEVEKVNP